MPILDRVEDFERLPDSALLTAREIKSLSGRSLASIWRDVKSKRLSKPIALGPNASRWTVGDVRAYLRGGLRHD